MSQPDQSFLLAWERATTGANAHDMARQVWYYKYLCEQGEEEKAQWNKEQMYVRLRSLAKQDGYDRFQR